MADRSGISVRRMEEGDVAEAAGVMRLAFGTFHGAPNPANYGGDAEMVLSRWRIVPDGAFVAVRDGKVAGSNFLTHWGSVGFYGPLSVDPSLWNAGVGGILIKACLDEADRRGISFMGVYTYPESAAHLASHQRFGFLPRHLTAIMRKNFVSCPPPSPFPTLFSGLSPSEKKSALASFAALTDSIHPGLDVGREISALIAHGMGDVIMTGGGGVEGFAVCHAGASTEAGSGVTYVKFAAVGGNKTAPLRALVEAAASYGLSKGCPTLVAGVNTARVEAYRELIGMGFGYARIGVALHRPDVPAYNRPGVMCLDDWR